MIIVGKSFEGFVVAVKFGLRSLSYELNKRVKQSYLS